MTGALVPHDRRQVVRRSTSNSASGDGSDRTTTPGVGDDARDTLPEPLAPSIRGSGFKRTIPMGSSQVSEWQHAQAKVAMRGSESGQSGVHSLGPAQPAVVTTDDKRWIGTADLGRTLRIMTVPPPAGGEPTKRSAPSPIKPAPTISISPEISIPTRSEPRAPQMMWTPAVPEPTLDAAELPPRPFPLNTDGRDNEAQPIATAASASAWRAAITAARRVRWTTLRSTILILALCAVVALVAVVATLRFSAAVARPSPTPIVAAPTAAAPPPPIDLRPATEIVTNPPGAEIVLRGALVANSPARIVRPPYESLYLLRLRGYQPQLVALSMHSPDTIRIDLQPIAASP